MAAPIITPTNKSAGFQATDLFSTIFSVTGSVTSYNVALAGPNDGTVTGGPTVTPGVVTNVTPPQFNAMSFVGALNAGTDTLYLQAVGSGGTSAWVAATLTDTGAIVANPTSLSTPNRRCSAANCSPSPAPSPATTSTSPARATAR